MYFTEKGTRITSEVGECLCIQGFKMNTMSLHMVQAQNCASLVLNRNHS
jgi:hypothetical protein